MSPPRQNEKEIMNIGNPLLGYTLSAPNKTALQNAFHDPIRGACEGYGSTALWRENWTALDRQRHARPPEGAGGRQRPPQNSEKPNAARKAAAGGEVARGRQGH